MVKEVYCKYCDKDVQLVKKEFSWALFFAWTILSLGVLIWVYPVYRVFVQNTRCHNCKGIVINWKLQPKFEREENGSN